MKNSNLNPKPNYKLSTEGDSCGCVKIKEKTSCGCQIYETSFVKEPASELPFKILDTDAIDQRIQKKLEELKVEETLSNFVNVKAVEHFNNCKKGSVTLASIKQKIQNMELKMAKYNFSKADLKTSDTNVRTVKRLPETPNYFKQYIDERQSCKKPLDGVVSRFGIKIEC